MAGEYDSFMMNSSISSDFTSNFLLASPSVNGVRWLPRIDSPQGERQALAMMQQLGLPGALARVLAGRGVDVESAEPFLNPTLKNLLPDPSHLRDMDAAAARIAQAIVAGETVAVFGDYDVDGATSTALLKRYFAALGRDILVYIPDRAKEGYGPNIAAFEQLKAQGATLILTVDCGTVAREPIAAIVAQGVEVIVVDHHMAEPELPSALVVNPNRLDQDSEYGHLAAVGMVFLLLVALSRTLRTMHFFADKPEPNLLQWLDLVALGTVCDVVPLKTLNRAFVAQGLKVMAQRGNAGLRALADVARLDEAPNTYHAGFLIGPRINAGGRVGAANLGTRILSSEDAAECEQIAQQLDAYNAERQAIEMSVLEAAMAQAERQANMPCSIVAGEGWHEGVIGIVAGRLKEAFNKPAAVIAVASGKGKGSARSVSGADMGAAITAARIDGLLSAGGGHSMAAGFSLDMANYDAFVAYLNARLSAAVDAYAHERAWLYDGLLSVRGLTLSLLDQLERAAPFGMGNPAPKWVLSDVRVKQCSRMKDKHLRVMLSDNTGNGWLSAVTFNSVGTPLGDVLENAGSKALHVAGTAKRNRFNGTESVQFMIEDVAWV